MQRPGQALDDQLSGDLQGNERTAPQSYISWSIHSEGCAVAQVVSRLISTSATRVPA
jgi:hypothetical protein